MSAYLDRTQEIGFYFGNASQELAHRLPPEDQVRAAQELTLESLNQKTDEILSVLGNLERKNSELSYFVSDVLKLLK
jgi:hypothetical protein